MPPYVAHVAFAYKTNVPRDVSVNTFWFDGAGTDRDADALAISDRLANFYNDEGTGDNAITYWYSDYIPRTAGAMTIRVYDHADPQPRQPISSTPYTPAPAVSSTSLPLEVAVVCSFQAQPQSGVNQARRRGRVFLGPLASPALSYNSSQSTPPLITPAFREEVSRAARTLAANTDGGIQWIVRSRVSSSSAPVWSGWVDDDFDTQRRRGPRPMDREVWTLSI